MVVVELLIFFQREKIQETLWVWDSSRAQNPTYTCIVAHRHAGLIIRRIRIEHMAPPRMWEGRMQEDTRDRNIADIRISIITMMYESEDSLKANGS